MVLLEEELLDNDCSKSSYKDSLLNKYEIPIDHLDFSYVETCEDGKELERILQILRSQEEGYYPELIKTTEDCLAKVKPKSKLLRKPCPIINRNSLGNEDKMELKEDMENWLEHISKHDSQLDKVKPKSMIPNLPEIRSNKCTITQSENTETKKGTKRISATDYKSWDKYDADTEILKMDMEEEKRINKAKIEYKPKSTCILKKIDNEIEAEYEAIAEKEKGNEFFRIGDYEEALQHYSNSIAYNPTTVGYTNRAITNIKLKNFGSALRDSEAALKLDGTSIKALLRKSQALEGLEKYQNALETIEQLIRIDPNNSAAQELAEKLQKKCGVTARRKRIAIVEECRGKATKGTNKQKNGETGGEVLIPIPGTSKMSPPHYIRWKKGNSSKIKEEMLKIKAKSQVVSIISVDEDSDDDCCTVNHLDHISKSRDRLNRENDNSRGKARTNFTKTTKQITDNKDGSIGESTRADPNEHLGPFDDIHSPYTFLKVWNSTSGDVNHESHAQILRKIDMTRIVQVIGCKLDNAMFSAFIECLSAQFMFPGEVEKIYAALENISRVPRFNIIAMFMSDEDKRIINMLTNFLKQHGRDLPDNIVNRF